MVASLEALRSASNLCCTVACHHIAQVRHLNNLEAAFSRVLCMRLSTARLDIARVIAYWVTVAKLQSAELQLV